MRGYIYAPMDRQSRLRKRYLDSIGRGGNLPRRIAGRIQPHTRFCVHCWSYCGGRCRIESKPPQPSRRTPVGKRRDKRGQRRRERIEAVLAQNHTSAR